MNDLLTVYLISVNYLRSSHVMQQYKVLQFAILCAIVLVEDKTLYEYFDFDIENAVFEWDEEKDRINYTKHGIHF